MSKMSKCSRSAEDFMNIVNKYEILQGAEEYSGPLHSNEGIKNPQESSMIDILRDVTQLREEISTIKITTLEIVHKKQLNKISESYNEQRQIIEDMTKALELIAENQLIISKICSAPLPEDSLPIPKHLHVKLVSLFKNFVSICKNYGSIAKIFTQAHELDPNTMDQELTAALSHDYHKCRILRQNVETIQTLMTLIQNRDMSELIAKLANMGATSSTSVGQGL